MNPRDRVGTMTLTFENDGVTVHKATEGFQGADCMKVTEFIEQVLNASVTEMERTREYYDDDRRTEEGIRA